MDRQEQTKEANNGFIYGIEQTEVHIKNCTSFCFYTTFRLNKIQKNKVSQEEAHTPNMGFCNIGPDGITMRYVILCGILLGQMSFNLAFCCYIQINFFYWASVPGGRFSNPPTTPSPVR